jgi:glutamate dehydrogenase (NAD(P)+)
MTLKNAAAGLAHGGGKAVIAADPRMPRADKERLIRAFACAMRDITDYIPGPDMGTDEHCMAWVRDEIGRAAGLPPVLGGIPLDEIGTTGFGLVTAIEAALPYCGLSLAGARVAIQGFGAVGRHAARFLVAKGAVLVAASDTSATLFDGAGIDVAALTRHKLAGRALRDYAGGEKRDAGAVIDVACDIWIPAARPDVLQAQNVGRLQAKLVAEGANIPATAEAEAALHARGVLVLPDFIANAGGVISAAVEYRGGTEADAFAAIGEKIKANTEAVLRQARERGEQPRAAAMTMAKRRVEEAGGYRRWDGR